VHNKITNCQGSVWPPPIAMHASISNSSLCASAAQKINFTKFRAKFAAAMKGQRHDCSFETKPLEIAADS
jgi:hypothetical protein